MEQTMNHTERISKAVTNDTISLMGCYKQLEEIYRTIANYVEKTSCSAKEVDSILDTIVAPSYDEFRRTIADLIGQSIANDLYYEELKEE